MSYLEVYNRNLKTYIQIINKFLLRTKQGHIEKVKDAIITLPFKIPRKIRKKDFLTEGKIPIVDQGQSFIAGYTDDNLALIKKVPIIIFGDHTRTFKYIYFPFAQGADGVKMLSPKKEYLPEYFFFQLQSVAIEDRGYSRHYKYLLEHEIVSVKNTDLQKSIVMFLRHLEKNELKSSTYFNLEVESRIASLQKSSLRISFLSNSSKNEESMIQELLQAILQEAVSGKLIPQDPKDDPATELLKKIKNEKEKLIKEKKFKKEKDLRPITKEELPYELPTGWAWVRFGELIKLISGQHIMSSLYNTNSKGIPYITGPADFGERNPIISKWTESPKVISTNGDILITVKGAGLGKLNVTNLDRVAISRQLMAIRPILINREYVFILLKQKFSHFQSSGVGIAIPGLGRDDIMQLPFPLPPLSEQERIVERVGHLIMLCVELEEKVKENQNNSELLMEAVLKEAFAS